VALTGTIRDHPKHSDTLFAHDGNNGTSQSGIVLKGRDRSKATLLRREEQKRREIEDDEEDDALSSFGTPKVRHYGPIWRNLALTVIRRLAVDSSESLRPLLSVVSVFVRRLPPPTPSVAVVVVAVAVEVVVRAADAIRPALNLTDAFWRVLAAYGALWASVPHHHAFSPGEAEHTPAWVILARHGASWIG
jgi:hypothetical protein